MSSKNAFTLDASDPDSAIEPFASDFNRFASASFESVISISAVPLSDRALAWAAVKLYYAAFFAAHALLRLAGIAVSYVDSDLASDLTAIWKGYGLGGAFAISAGSYEMRVASKSSVMSATKKGGSGGHHAALWKSFVHFIDALVKAVSSDSSAPRGAIEYISSLESLRNTLFVDKTFGLLLTDTRNEINYRQTHGVWFPYSGKGKAKYSNITAVIERWSEPADPAQIGANNKDDLMGLFRTSVFLVAACREFVESMAVATPRSFVANRSYKLLRLARA